MNLNGTLNSQKLMVNLPDLFSNFPNGPRAFSSLPRPRNQHFSGKSHALARTFPLHVFFAGEQPRRGVRALYGDVQRYPLRPLKSLEPYPRSLGKGAPSLQITMIQIDIQ